MKYYLKQLLVLAVITIVIFSCQKDEDLESAAFPSLEKPAVVTPQQVSDARARFAKALARVFSALLYYCDDANGEGTTYNTGKLLFNIKEEEL